MKKEKKDRIEEVRGKEADWDGHTGRPRGVTTSREMLEAAEAWRVGGFKTEEEKESDYSTRLASSAPARLEINSGRHVILKRCIILGSEMERLGQRPWAWKRTWETRWYRRRAEKSTIWRKITRVCRLTRLIRSDLEDVTLWKISAKKYRGYIFEKISNNLFFNNVWNNTMILRCIDIYINVASSLRSLSVDDSTNRRLMVIGINNCNFLETEMYVLNNERNFLNTIACTYSMSTI